MKILITSKNLNVFLILIAMAGSFAPSRSFAQISSVEEDTLELSATKSEEKPLLNRAKKKQSHLQRYKYRYLAAATIVLASAGIGYYCWLKGVKEKKLADTARRQAAARKRAEERRQRAEERRQAAARRLQTPAQKREELKNNITPAIISTIARLNNHEAVEPIQIPGNRRIIIEKAGEKFKLTHTRQDGRTTVASGIPEAFLIQTVLNTIGN